MFAGADIKGINAEYGGAVSVSPGSQASERHGGYGQENSKVDSYDIHIGDGVGSPAEAADAQVYG